MKHKYFTFLYIPVGNTAPRTIRVRRALIYSLATTVVLAFGVATAAVVKYGDKIKDTYKLATIERQNAQLRSQLADVGTQIEELERGVTENFNFQKKARLLANLDELDQDVVEVGVGGPDYAYVRSLSSLDADTRSEIMGARDNVGKLLRQAELQSASYQEILEKLEETSDVLRHTPSLRPVNVGFVSSRFGRRMDPITGRRQMHRGVDYSARKGTPVFSTADGVVTFSGTWKTYGKVVEISHGHGFVTRFAHLEKQLVKKGQKVKRGDVVARVGQTGRSTFTHLHYEVEKDGHRIDPLKFVLSH